MIVNGLYDSLPQLYIFSLQLCIASLEIYNFCKMKQTILALILLIICLQVNCTEQLPVINPQKFSWDDVNGTSYLGPVKSQNFPNFCNSGWAFSTIGMLESRIKSLRKASSPDISLSTQILLSCDTLDFGCLGGEPINALRFIAKNNITD